MRQANGRCIGHVFFWIAEKDSCIKIKKHLYINVTFTIENLRKQKFKNNNISNIQKSDKDFTDYNNLLTRN